MKQALEAFRARNMGLKASIATASAREESLTMFDAIELAKDIFELRKQMRAILAKSIRKGGRRHNKLKRQLPRSVIKRRKELLELAQQTELDLENIVEACKQRVETYRSLRNMFADYFHLQKHAPDEPTQTKSKKRTGVEPC